MPGLTMTTPGMMGYAYNPNNWEAEASQAGVQGHPRLPRESEVSLSYKILSEKGGGGVWPGGSAGKGACHQT